MSFAAAVRRRKNACIDMGDRDREGEKKSWLKSLVVARETETEREKRRQAEREASANEDSKWN